jgi:hypothetical protein
MLDGKETEMSERRLLALAMLAFFALVVAMVGLLDLVTQPAVESPTGPLSLMGGGAVVAVVVTVIVYKNWGP